MTRGAEAPAKMGMSAYKHYVFFILSSLSCWYLLAAWVQGKHFPLPEAKGRKQQEPQSLSGSMTQREAQITDSVTLFCFTPVLSPLGNLGLRKSQKLSLIHTWESKKVSTIPTIPRGHISLTGWVDAGVLVAAVLVSAAALLSAAATHGCGLKAELILTTPMARNQSFLHTLTLRSSRNLA